MSVDAIVIGAFGPCTDIYDSMEAKHIINDTLG